jgi:hypothetical protein
VCADEYCARRFLFSFPFHSIPLRYPNVTPTHESFDLLIVHVAIRFRNIYFVPMSSPRETCPKNANVLFTSGAEKKKAIEKNCTHTHTPKKFRKSLSCPAAHSTATLHPPTLEGSRNPVSINASLDASSFQLQRHQSLSPYTPPLGSMH